MLPAHFNNGFHLQSHLNYLEPKNKSLIELISNWIINDLEFDTAKENSNIRLYRSDATEVSRRHLTRIIQTFLLYFILPLFVVLVTGFLSLVSLLTNPSIIYFFIGKNYGIDDYLIDDIYGIAIRLFSLAVNLLFIYILLIPILVLIFGLFRYLSSTYRRKNLKYAKQDIKKYFEIARGTATKYTIITRGKKTLLTLIH